MYFYEDVTMATSTFTLEVDVFDYYEENISYGNKERQQERDAMKAAVGDDYALDEPTKTFIVECVSYADATAILDSQDFNSCSQVLEIDKLTGAEHILNCRNEDTVTFNGCYYGGYRIFANEVLIEEDDGNGNVIVYETDR